MCSNKCVYIVCVVSNLVICVSILKQTHTRVSPAELYSVFSNECVHIVFLASNLVICFSILKRTPESQQLNSPEKSGNRCVYFECVVMCQYYVCNNTCIYFECVVCVCIMCVVIGVSVLSV